MLTAIILRFYHVTCCVILVLLVFCLKDPGDKLCTLSVLPFLRQFFCSCAKALAFHTKTTSCRKRDIIFFCSPPYLLIEDLLSSSVFWLHFVGTFCVCTFWLSSCYCIIIKCVAPRALLAGILYDHFFLLLAIQNQKKRRKMRWRS